jgi:hypothetical protein
MKWKSMANTTTNIEVNTMEKADFNDGQDPSIGADRRTCVLDGRQNTAAAAVQALGFVERRKSQDRRRSPLDRRLGLDRRRGPGKRRSDDRRAAEEGQMSDEQFHFLMAIDEYKKANARPFPTWTEVLEIIKALGYRKVADPQPLGKKSADQPE